MNVALSWLGIEALGTTAREWPSSALTCSTEWWSTHCRAPDRLRWSAANRRVGLIYIAAVGLVFSSFLVLSGPWATAVGALVLLASCAHSASELLTVAAPEALPAHCSACWRGLAAPAPHPEKEGACR